MLLARDESTRVKVQEEGGYVTFRCKSELPTNLVHDIRNAPQETIEAFRRRPGVYTASDIAAMVRR
jgi:hypothetical protein